MIDPISRFFARFLRKENEAGTWPRPAVGLPPKRLYEREGFHVNLPGAREVRSLI